MREARNDRENEVRLARKREGEGERLLSLFLVF